MRELTWQKSSYSEGGASNCVEVAASAAGVTHLRESDDPHTVLTAAPATLGTLIGAVKAGAFDDLAREH